MSTTPLSRMSLRTGAILFAIVQVVFLSAVGAALAYRVSERQKARLLPPPHNEPTVIAPQYNYPWVISDEQLQSVLHKLRPRLREEKPIIGHIDHALRFWGVEAKFNERSCFSGKEMRDILLDHKTFKRYWKGTTPPLVSVEKTGAKVRTQEGRASTSHVDHSLAALAEVGTPLDYPILTLDADGQEVKTTMREMLAHALRDFSLNQIEYEWSTLAFALYVAPERQWVTTEGQTITFDLLVDRILRQPFPQGVCFGNHRLHTLTVLLRVDDKTPILEPSTRGRIIAHLQEATRRLVKNQNQLGYWDGHWSAADYKPASETSPEGNLSARILATGHALEWWALAPEATHPPRETLIRAGQWLTKTVTEMDDATVKKQFTFLSHAGRALSLWRGDFPHKLYVPPEPSKLKQVLNASK